MVTTEQDTIATQFTASDEIQEKSAYEWQTEATTLMQAGNYKKAGDAYTNAGEVNLQNQDLLSAGRMFKCASTMYYKTSVVTGDISPAVKAEERAVEIFAKIPCLNSAAVSEKRISVLLVQTDLQGAMEHYLNAANYYEADGMDAHASECIKEAALIAALLKHYEKAAKSIEDLAAKCAGHRLRRFTVADHLFDAGICILASGNQQDLLDAIKRFDALLPQWSESRDGKLIATLATANKSEYGKIIDEHYKVYNPSKWRLQMFDRLKKME
jgi:tetratricopeptide (TPR) repeat protein